MMPSHAYGRRVNENRQANAWESQLKVGQGKETFLAKF